MIEPDDFALWRDSPVTQTLFRALTNMAAEAKASWVAGTWDHYGTPNEMALHRLKAIAQVCTDITEMTLDEIEEKAGA